jgi:hypothetical protein
MTDGSTRTPGAIRIDDICRTILGHVPKDLSNGVFSPAIVREFVDVLTQKGRGVMRPDRWRSGARYLLGYNMACLARSIERPEGYFLSLPAVGFADQRQALRQLLLTLLVYSAEVVLPLEASEPGGTLLGLSQAQPINLEAANGLLALVAELSPLVENDLLQIPVCHFYYDGVKFLQSRMDGLRRLGFCGEDVLGKFFVGSGPELRADFGLSVFCRADLSVDLEEVYTHTCSMIGTLQVDSDHYHLYSSSRMQSERRALFFVPLQMITLPHFQPRSVDRLMQLRASPAVRKLHGLMEHVQLPIPESVTDGRLVADAFRVAVDNELHTISNDMELLARKDFAGDVTRGVITLRHSVLLMELPAVLPALWRRQSFEVGWAAGSGLHGFSHWLDRRIAPGSKFTVALLVRQIHLDE